MHRSRLILSAPLAALLTVVFAFHPASAQTEFFPIDELREGMRGTGRTVFHGTAVEDFDVEILGVLRNSSARQDLILARLSGGPLEETGVLQGMSGSPVYIDGRLVGAVAFAFDGSIDPIAGIQPIGQMVGVLDDRNNEQIAVNAPVLPAEGPAAYMYRVMSALRAGEPLGDQLYPGGWSPLDAGAVAGGMRPIRTPVFVAGLSAETVAEFRGAMDAFGMTPVQGGIAGSAAAGTPGPVTVEPGMSINAEMVRGDIHISANGTVTHIDGDQVYAFGHPFQSAGPSDMPMSAGYVMALVPTRTTSFKIAAPLEVIGAFEQDLSTGIRGRLGRQAGMIPVEVEVETSRGATETYRFEVIDDRFMAPLMMNVSLFEILTTTERSLGPLTLEVTGRLELRNGDSVVLEAASSGDLNAPAEATLAAVAPMTYLLSGDYDPLRVREVRLSIRATDRRRSARLESVRVDRDRVRAGETVQVEATLRTLAGEEFREQYAVPIPEGLAPGTIELIIGDGVAVTGIDLRRAPARPPRNMEQVLRDLESLRKPDRLYAKLVAPRAGAVIGGAELPSLPPSMLDVLGSRRTSDSIAASTSSSPVIEFELTPTGYVVSGQQTVEVTLIP
jgi:hypothetical protein